MSKKKVLIYNRFNRFWHWSQALLIFLLAFTGFEIRGLYNVLGLQKAVDLHNILALALIVLILFAIFWHFTTGTWKHYVPTKKNVFAMVMFYSVDIFKGAEHPVHKSVVSKLNPLQRIAYFQLKIFLIPLQVATGILYLFHYYFASELKTVGGLEMVATLHTIGAFAMLSFVIGHIYLTTTGDTIFSNLKAMITGWEELEE